jgi:amino acid adenylation domain-containing protein
MGMTTNVLDYLERTVPRFPDKVAFHCEGQMLTFAQLSAQSQHIASALVAHARPREPVAVISGKSVLTVSSYMGVVQAGCFYAPIDAELPIERIKSILGIVAAPVLLCDQSQCDLIASLGFTGRVIFIDEALNSRITPEILLRRRQLSIDTDPVCSIFTSGSTGLPKGVICTHRGLIDYLEALCEVVSIDETDVLGNQAPLDYIAGIRDIYLPLRTGASSILLPKALFSQPSRLFGELDAQGVTTIFWVASALSACVELGAFTQSIPHSLRKIIFTGSVLPTRHLRLWQEKLPGRFFMNQYGPTEITASCTYHVVQGLVDDNEELPIGRPFRNTAILLLDEQGNEIIEPNTVGEICVRGTCLSPGYYRDDERSSAVFTPNPVNEGWTETIYHTGDLGLRDREGLFYFRGRKDNQIKHMGHRVELDEIAAIAAGMERVGECACLYHAEKQTIFLFYTGDIQPRDIAIALRGCLPTFMVPRRYIHLEHMPLLHNGKLDRDSLKESVYAE